MITPRITDARCREILAQFGYFDHDKVFCVFTLTDEQCGLLERVAEQSGLEGAELLEWMCRKAIGEQE
jgi:hypothetical protein